MTPSSTSGWLKALPNLITVSRCIIGVLGAWLLVKASQSTMESQAVVLAVSSGALFVISALSDFIDGWLARAIGAVSALGALLDPIADKVLVGSYLIAFVLISRFDPFLTPAVVIIVGRDVLVTALRLSRLNSREVPLPVTDEAKFKTGLHMVLIALPFLLVLTGLRDVEGWFYYWVGGVWLAALLSAWTAMPYLRKAFSGQR